MKNRWFRGSVSARIVVLLGASVVLASCARPVGDFGRAKSSFSHDTVAPAVGKYVARKRGETVSLFSRTDEELKLANLAWTIVRPVHSADWISGSLIEARRTRIFPDINKRLDFRAYLFWLKLERFTSSEARWNRIISDIRADQAAIAPFYDQARLVYVIDQQRLAHLEATKNIESSYQENTKARLEENENLIQLALDSLEFRHAAYAFAIKRLKLELPSARAQIADDELERYADLIERGGERGLPFIENPELLSSRIKLEDPKQEKDSDAKVLK